jgi:hypothetical protein
VTGGEDDPDSNRTAPEPQRRVKYTAAEVETLTRRADELLRQLHDVLGEIATHLKAVGKGGKS